MTPPPRSPRIGLALAGGGPLGAIYEIGALAALSESLRGIDFNHADVYVGVSAGAFIAAGLVNGITPHQMSRLFIEGQRSADRFDPAILLRPALREYWQRLRSLPPLAAGPRESHRQVQRRRSRPLPEARVRAAGSQQ
jgi:predicted acylesterase/phospholipase RssA